MNDYMILQDQEDIKFQQPRAQQQQHNEAPTVRESTHREEYQRIMSFKGLDISRQSLINKLRHHHIYQQGLSNFYELSFPNIHHSKNCEIMEVEVHLGWLLIKIRIINIDVKEYSPVHACTCIGGGSFGKIYRYATENTVKAIKCFTINPHNRIQDYLTLAIAEYCLLKVASIAGSGPAMKSEGFDIFFYKSQLLNKQDDSIEKRYCIEFETQCCEGQSNFCTEDRQALFKSLHVLHLLNLVHCDIKPDNIMYSPTLKRWVFIDFGVSTILKESYGYCSKTKYRGTLKYSCQEMKKLYENLYIFKQQSEEYIDLYWNDVHGLKLSCSDIQKREKIVIRNHQTVEGKDQTSIQQHFLLADFKYCLYFGNKQLQQYYLDSINWDKTKRLNIIYFLFELKSISEKIRTLFSNFLCNFSEAIELIVFQKLLSDVKSSLNYDQEEDFICQQHVRYKRLFFHEIPQCLEMAKLQNYNNEQLVLIHQTKHIENVIAYVKSNSNEGYKQDDSYLSVIFNAVNLLKSKYGTDFSSKVEICKIFYQQRGNTDELPSGVDYIKYFMCEALKVSLQSKKRLLRDYFIQIFANVLMLGEGTLQTIKAVYSTVFTISSNYVKTCQYFLQLYYLNFWSEQIIYDSHEKDHQGIKRYIVSVMHTLCSKLQVEVDYLHRHCSKADGFCMEMEENMLKRIESEALSTKDSEQSHFQLTVRRCEQTLKLFRTRLKRSIDDEPYYSNIQEIPMNLMYFFIHQFYILNTQSFARISYIIERFISCPQISDQWGFILKMKTFYKLQNFRDFQDVQLFNQVGVRKNVQRIRTFYEIIIQERYSQESTMEAQHHNSELIVRDCERALYDLGNAFSQQELASVLMKLKEVQARGIWHYLTILLTNNKERVMNILKILYDEVGRQKCLVKKGHILLKLGEFMLRKQLVIPQYQINEQAILCSSQQGSLLDIKLKYLQQIILETQANTKSSYLLKFHQITQRNHRYNDFLLKTIIFKVYISLLQLLIKHLQFKEAIDLICKLSQNLLYLLSKKTALLSKKINMLLHYLFITKRYNHFKHWQHFRTLWVEKTLKERNKIAGFYNLTIVFIDFNAYQLATSVYNEQNVPQLVLPSDFKFLEGQVLKRLLYGYSKFLVSKIPIFQIYEVEMYYKLILHLYNLKQQRHQYIPALHKKHLFRLHMKSLVASCPIDYEYAMLAEKTKHFKKQEYYYNIYIHREYPSYYPSLQPTIKEMFKHKVDKLIHPHEGIINKKVHICK